MSVESSMVSYYAERANEYEGVYHKPERQDDLKHLHALIGRTFTGLNVFELACGTGYWTKILAASAASVLATDINQEVLAIARSKDIDALKTTFATADAYDLPTPAKQFNGGLAAFWWSHVPKARLRGFLADFHRVFEPGAKVVFIDNRYVEGSSTAIARTDEQGNTYQLRTLADGRTYEVLKNFPTETDLLVATEGLAMAVEIQFLQYYWILSYLVGNQTAATSNVVP